MPEANQGETRDEGWTAHVGCVVIRDGNVVDLSLNMSIPDGRYDVNVELVGGVRRAMCNSCATFRASGALDSSICNPCSRNGYDRYRQYFATAETVR